MRRTYIYRGVLAWCCALLVCANLAGAGSTQDLSPMSAPSSAAEHGMQGQPFTFGLWGDMPYAREGDDPKIPVLTEHMNAANLAFSVFDGDFKDGSSECSDGAYAAAIERFNRFQAPMVFVPGDNEWTDCHRLNNGGYNNRERLDYLRRTMFGSPESLGQQRMTLEQQGLPGGMYSENTRWSYGDVIFAGLNVVGSNNNKVNRPEECQQASARTLEDCDADNAEYEARDAANIRWLRESFQLARQRGALGVMIVIQADPGFDVVETFNVNERNLPQYGGFTNFLDALVAETQSYTGQVVLVHGDTHFFKLDKPLFDQARMIRNFTRLETFGSPNVHWVRVDVDPANPNVFTFIPMLVPGN